MCPYQGATPIVPSPVRPRYTIMNPFWYAVVYRRMSRGHQHKLFLFGENFQSRAGDVWRGEEVFQVIWRVFGPGDLQNKQKEPNHAVSAVFQSPEEGLLGVNRVFLEKAYCFISIGVTPNSLGAKMFEDCPWMFQDPTPAPIMFHAVYGKIFTWDRQ